VDTKKVRHQNRDRSKGKPKSAGSPLDPFRAKVQKRNLLHTEGTGGQNKGIKMRKRVRRGGCCKLVESSYKGRGTVMTGDRENAKPGAGSGAGRGNVQQDKLKTFPGKTGGGEEKPTKEPGGKGEAVRKDVARVEGAEGAIVNKRGKRGPPKHKERKK